MLVGGVCFLTSPGATTSLQKQQPSLCPGMLENREDPGTEGAEPAGVEDEEDAEEQEGEESGPAQTL